MIVLRRSPFRKPGPPPRPAREWTGSLPTPRQIVAARTDSGLRLVAPVPKENARRSEKYRRWISTLACAHCRKSGPSQCAHSDADGKAMALKSSDEFCYPLCADGPGYVGCHSRIGASGEFGRDGRRAMESLYGATTQALARHTGNWPKDWK